MVKLFKSHVLSIAIAVAFTLSQIVNANANHLKSNPQKEEISVSVIEQGRKQATNMAAFYVPGFNYGAENDAAVEGKFEKVFEPITLGVFSTIGAVSFGLLTGSVMGILSGLLGWAIGKTKNRR